MFHGIEHVHAVAPPLGVSPQYHVMLRACCLSALQGADELSIVEQASMNKNAIEDSFARVGYHQDAEYAVNEQIK